MPYRNKQMLRDANGDLIPQYWDVAAGDFKPLTGSGGANDTRLTGSNVEDGLTTKSRKVEVFHEDDVVVEAGSFVEFTHFDSQLKYGRLTDMREYSHVYFGAQRFVGSGNYHIIIRQKPVGTGGSIIDDIKTESDRSTKAIVKSPINFHNLSIRVYNDSEEEHSYTLAAGFWPI